MAGKVNHIPAVTFRYRSSQLLPCRPVLQSSQLDRPSRPRQLLHQSLKLMPLLAEVQRHGPVRETEQAEHPHRMPRRPLPWPYRNASRAGRVSWRANVDDQRHAFHPQRAATDARKLKRQVSQIRRRRSQHEPDGTWGARHRMPAIAPNKRCEIQSPTAATIRSSLTVLSLNGPA